MIYLIRHGEPAAGWGEHLDPGLSPLGQTQAEAAARLLGEAGARRIVTSPLARCQETARPFEKLLETHARIDPSVGEVRTPREIEDRAAWLKGVMGGEWAAAGHDFSAWRNGVLAAVSACPDDTAIFSHFIAINVLVGLLTGDDRVVIFKPGHCSITKLRKTPSGKLEIVELGQEGPLVLL
jgi:broad specificity phosphatase PhoE